MKKIISLFLCSMLVFSLSNTVLAGEDSSSGLLIVRCEEQGFSTLCDGSYSYDYHPDAGITIYADETEDGPYVTVFKAEGSGFHAEGYFSNAYTPLMKTAYGSKLVDAGEYKEYNIAGMLMPGQLCLYQEGDDLMGRFCLYDIREDSFIRYEAFFTESELNTAVSIIATAAAYYQPDPYYYDQASEGPSNQEPDDLPDDPLPEDPLPAPQKDLQIISCPEQEFSVLCNPGYTWDYEDNTGVTIYTEKDGLIPYIIIYRSEDQLGDPAEYIREQYTPHVQGKYGDDLLSYDEYDAYSLGGREMAAGLYTYRVQDYVINMLRCYDTIDGHTVIFTAKYIENEGEETLSALETVAETYQSDPAYYDSNPVTGTNEPQTEESSSVLKISDLLGYNPAILNNARVVRFAAFAESSKTMTEELSGEALERALRMAQEGVVTAKHSRIDGTGARNYYIYYDGDVKLLTLSFYEGYLDCQDGSYEIEY